MDVCDELVKVLWGRAVVGREIPGFSVVAVSCPVKDLMEQSFLDIERRRGGNTGVFLADLGQVPGGIHVDIRVSHGGIGIWIWIWWNLGYVRQAESTCMQLCVRRLE